MQLGGFDCSNIPNNVTITSVSCKARCVISSISIITSRSVQLYNGTNTPKGNGVDYQTSTSVIQTLECGQWNRQELETCHIRVSAVRSDNNRYKNSSANLRFYGATLTVNYTWYETFYSVSTSSNVQGVSISSTSGETLEGGSNTITLSNVSDISTIRVMDNGNDITSLFTRSGSNYVYTLTNINADHTIVVEDASSSSKKSYVKKNNAFVESTNQYVKESNSWVNRTISKIFWKINGTWSETNDSMSGKTAFKIDV